MSSRGTLPKSAYSEYLDSELASESERSIHSTLTQVGRYALLKFGVAAISSPFETARLLRQIQCNNGDEEEEEVPDDVRNAQSAWWDATLMDQQRKEREEHFSKRESQRIGEMYASEGNIYGRIPSDISRDSTGYLSERLPAGYLSSQWPLNLNKHKSLWGSLGEISRRQGLFSLWQGVMAGWTHEVLMDVGRATVEEALESSNVLREHFGPLSLFAEDVVRPSLIAGVAQGIVGTLLTPVEFVRLRLVAQSVWMPERKYYGFWHALRTISREETGLFGLFKHPILTFTTSFIQPVLRILPVSLLNYYMTPAEDTSLALSIGWIALQNIITCVPLIITMPLETIRRRLLIQCTTSSRTPYITRVRTARPYSGLLNCLWRMVREEGVASLYQGWGFQVAARTASFATTLLAELGEEDLEDSDGF
ncbi:hypothetical protein PSACC_02747 [Paramicrosporidium saccamoebae]|uniref:Mitochondrial carrier n=1 Tax=Paramicrosporidium saccamoebae TaxID=1246581 RepID=A0A2H9TI81_9FUNG|nr:hypothetical protein PSACC_02747 [Paramicrosporidium saccamoebae]